MALVKVLLLRTLTKIAGAHLAAHVRNGVDDVSAQVLGTDNYVLAEMTAIGHNLAEGFSRLKLVISGKKIHFISSSREVVEGPIKAWDSYGM
eukprot:6305788-Pyramimonas_sp.AAC.1